MSALYDRLDSGEIDRPTAAELANIAGKIIKVYQVQLAREIFMAHLTGKIKPAGRTFDAGESESTDLVPQ